MIGEIIIICVCIVLSAYFSSIEAAFFSLSKLDVRKLENNKAQNSAIIAYFKQHTHKFIISVLIGNNIVNILSASLATKVTLDAVAGYSPTFENFAIGVSTFIMTLVLLTFGEIIPKSFAAAKAEFWTTKTIHVVYWISRLFTPFTFLFDKFTQFFFSLLGIDVGKKQQKITEDAIRDVIHISMQDGTLTRKEAEYMKNVMDFADKTAADCLTPLVKTTCVEKTQTLTQTMELLIETGYSRLPVKSQEKIIGVVHMKDVMAALAKNKKLSLTKIMAKPLIVPEQMKLIRLITFLQKRHAHLAVVVNEHGSYEGIITLEDAFEEVFGDVNDETDGQDVYIQKTKNGYRVAGDCPLDVFCQVLSVTTQPTAAQTVSGYVLEHSQRLPRLNEKIQIADLTFLVTKRTDTKITELYVNFQD